MDAARQLFCHKSDNFEMKRVFLCYLVPCAAWARAGVGRSWNRTEMATRDVFVRAEPSTTRPRPCHRSDRCVCALPPAAYVFYVGFFPWQFRSLANINFRQIFVLLVDFFFVVRFSILNLLWCLKWFLLKFYAYKHGVHGCIDNCQACLNNNFILTRINCKWNALFKNKERKKNN